MVTILDTLIDVNSKLKAGVPMSAWKSKLACAVTLLENGKSLSDAIDSPITEGKDIPCKECVADVPDQKREEPVKLASVKPETSKVKSKKAK